MCFLFHILSSRNYCQLGTVCEESGAMTLFTPKEIWKLHAVEHGIQAGSSDGRLIYILMKTEHPVHIICFAWLLTMPTLCLYSSTFMSSDSSRWPTSSALKKQTALFWIERERLLEDLTSSKRALC